MSKELRYALYMLKSNEDTAEGDDWAYIYEAMRQRGCRLSLCEAVCRLIGGPWDYLTREGVH